MSRGRKDFLFRCFLIALLFGGGFCFGQVIRAVHDMNAEIDRLNSETVRLSADSKMTASRTRELTTVTALLPQRAALPQNERPAK